MVALKLPPVAIHLPELQFVADPVNDLIVPDVQEPDAGKRTSSVFFASFLPAAIATEAIIKLETNRTDIFVMEIPLSSAARAGYFSILWTRTTGIIE